MKHPSSARKPPIPPTARSVTQHNFSQGASSSLRHSTTPFPFGTNLQVLLQAKKRRRRQPQKKLVMEPTAQKVLLPPATSLGAVCSQHGIVWRAFVCAVRPGGGLARAYRAWCMVLADVEIRLSAFGLTCLLMSSSSSSSRRVLDFERVGWVVIYVDQGGDGGDMSCVARCQCPSRKSL